MGLNTDWRLKRLEKRISLTEIAKSLGITTSYLCQYESGKKQLPESTYQAYVNYIINKREKDVE